MRDLEGCCPILILASGQRCGSTLVQRFLSSHPRVLIWGEHGGHLGEVLRRSKSLEAWDEGLATRARDAYEEGGHHSWMANLLPGPEAIADATRAYMLKLFSDPAAARGRSLWGFKEVRFGLSEANLIRELFPDTRVVHLTRDPRRVLASLEWWERSQGYWRREFTELALEHWLAVNESFLAASDRLPWLTSWRYEDMVADPERFIETLAEVVGLDADDFDRSVFDRRISDFQESGDRQRKLRQFETLPAELKGLLSDRVRSVAVRYGYSFDGGDG